MRACCLCLLFVIAGMVLAKEPLCGQEERVASPRPPALEQQSFELADPQLRVELVACEPQVQSPVAIAWDTDLRLYVAEMIGYPETKGLGRISRLEDRDRDGRYEQTTVFADGLDFPASVLPVAEGVLVIDAPDILLLRDLDDDGQADEREVLWTGFHPGSQQLRANALHWALDNWIYGANGRCDGEIRDPQNESSAAVSLRSRDFRFRPGSRRFEAIIGQSQFGQVHDDWGRRFLSWNTIPVRQAVYPEESLTATPALSSFAIVDLAAADDSGEVFPVSPPPRQFNGERANFYNAMCGLTILRSPGLGPEYQGNAFVGESLSNLITRRTLDGTRVVASSHRVDGRREFLAASDPWFHPVFLTTGPDGALYVVDFYRDLVEHPIYVASAEVRQTVDWRHGAEHGRIWRIVPRDQPVATGAVDAPSSWDDEQLVRSLAHPVGWWRDTAQRLLVQRNRLSAVPLLHTTLLRGDSPLGRLHALWTLEGLDSLSDDLLAAAITDRDAAVRSGAVFLAGLRSDFEPTVQAAFLSTAWDESAHVRFQGALAARHLPWEMRRDYLVDVIQDFPEELPTLRAALASAGEHVPALLEALMTVKGTSWRRPDASRRLGLLEFGRWMAGPIKESDLSPIVSVLAEIWNGNLDDSGRLALCAGIAEAEIRRGRAIAGRFDGIRRDQFERFGELLGQTVLPDADHPDAADLVRSSIALFEAAPKDIAGRVLMPLLRPGNAPNVQAAAARALVSQNDYETAAAIFADWAALSLPARRMVLRSASRSPKVFLKLEEFFEIERIPAGDFPADLLAEWRRSGVLMQQRLAAAVGGVVNVDRSEVLERYRPALTLKGDLERGARLFQQNCLGCHVIQGVGAAVGPDLSGIAGRPRDAVLVDILDPNRQVPQNYLAYIVQLKTGAVRTGLIASESAKSLVLRKADGETEAIAASEIEETQSTGQSLMPVGLEQKLDLQAMADLLEFLRQPSRKLLLNLNDTMSDGSK